MNPEASLCLAAELLDAAKGLMAKAVGSIDWTPEHMAHRNRIVELEIQAGVVRGHIKATLRASQATRKAEKGGSMVET